MDIMYLSHARLKELRKICADQLILNVLEDYCQHYKIIVSNEEEPQGLWCINHYLNETSELKINKLHMFIAFAHCGGFFQFEEGIPVFGDMNILSELLQREYINTDEYAYYTNLIYEARKYLKPLSFNLFVEL